MLFSLLTMLKGKVYDFGALEIQAVYISGNVREPFEYFMKDPKARSSMDWSNQPNYPRPDYLSSSRKRLATPLQRRHSPRLAKENCRSAKQKLLRYATKIKARFKIESRYRLAHIRCHVATDRCSYGSKLPDEVGQTRRSLQQVARFSSCQNRV